MFQKRFLCCCLVVAGALILSAWRRPGEPLKPSGLNFFSKDQDIQLGKEAATEVRKQVTVVQNQFLQEYIQHIGKRLTSQPEAGDWPFSFTVILDPNINAFALPGGPMFVNSGTIANADNEAQIAGVMGHEMSHVILRHGTKQASKANLLQIPAMLAGTVVGDGSLLAEMTKLGIGVGANSILLKYSRDDESQADALGTHLMSEAGYNPVELAHFFQKLEAQGGSRPLQFLSDHPNPGNREQAIQEEIQTLPKRQYSYQTGDFERAKAEVVKLPKLAPKLSAAAAADPAAARPSSKLQPFQGRSYSFAYPSNWQVFGDQNSDSITMAAREGIVQGSSGGAQVGYGVIASYFTPDEQGQSLSQATDDLVQHLHASNPSMKTAHSSRKTKVDGNPALITMLSSTSPLAGAGEETDALLTVARPQGLFYLVFIAPSGEFKSAESVLNDVVGSVRFQ
ncbi:MAG TPA: M48 family metallopeptidase [Bryobacteraceae bacterium]|nr:M48 family metallopeptidase [Bryobacteraceae bacterium]